jgi:glycosyltransferase involved in cell wall biosynthesis
MTSGLTQTTRMTPSLTRKPRVLFVGRGRIALPLAPWLAKKWDAISEVLDARVLNAGTGGIDPRFRLLPNSAPAYYGRLPLEIAAELRRFGPDVVIASDPYVGAAALAARTLAHHSARVVVEVHGQPKTFTRSYGSPARRLLTPFADKVATWSLVNADATRGLSAFTSSLIEEVRGLPATATFPTYSDLTAFSEPPLVPLPRAQRVVFVGALEPYKNPDVLADAWRIVAKALPRATLVVVGNGSRRAVIDTLVNEFRGQVEHYPRLPPDGVVAQLDRARALVLPSWPEGLGRVVLEAFARGRGVVATDAGGIPEIATDGVNSILLPPADGPALVNALRRILEDYDLAAQFSSQARGAYWAWHQTPEDFARHYRDLVERVVAGAH